MRRVSIGFAKFFYLLPLYDKHGIRVIAKGSPHRKDDLRRGFKKVL